MAMSSNKPSPGMARGAFPFPIDEDPAVQESASDRKSPEFAFIHPLDPDDAAVTASMRVMVAPLKGVQRGIEARGQFDALMESVLPRDEVTFEADVVGGIPGIWTYPAN